MADALRAELHALLSESPEAATARERSAFDQIAGDAARQIVLFGAGGLGRKTLAGLRRAGIEPLAFADNNLATWNTTIDGLIVLSPADATAKWAKTAVFVITIWRAGGKHRTAQFRKQCQDLGCTRIASFGLLYWKLPEIFLPYYTLDLPHNVLLQRTQVLDGYHLWADDFSRKQYVSQLRWRLHLDFDGLTSPVPGDQYFPEDVLTWSPQEYFVDCGAFDGDTLKSIVARHGKDFAGIFALEPDPNNFRAMQAYCASLPIEINKKITLSPLAASARHETVYFDASGTPGSAIGSGSLAIQCAPLDDILADRVPTFLKMDIEGAEPDALTGARRLIQKHLPLLAISLYHRQYHLWSIAQLIRSISDQYQFYMRPHNEECWDLVGYAVPPARQRRPLS